MKQLRCKLCPPILNFTVGKVYDFEWCYDPEGWEVKDDNGKKEVFFNTEIMFEETI